MSSRRVQKAPRKRTGCGSCKAAHVKCSEEKPTCKRCQRLSLHCQYEFRLLWEEDSLQRNIVHGRAGVWSRDGRRIEPLPGSLGFSSEREELVWMPLAARKTWEFIVFQSEDFVDGDPPQLQEESLSEAAGPAGVEEVDRWVGRRERSCFATKESTISATPDEETALVLATHPPKRLSSRTSDTALAMPLRSSLPLLSLSEIDSQLLTYYIHDLSPKCSLNAHLNPYLNVLLPVAYEFAPLRHALLASSACQLYHFSGNRQYELYSLHHRSKAIRGLNLHLNREHMDWKSLATMVMFCFRDITDGCEPSWITHLSMGLRMLKELLCTSRIDMDLRKFCEIYFVAHDVMGRTAWDEAVIESEHHEWDRDESYHEIDPIMGCSRELISLISQISCLAAASRRLHRSTQDLADSATKLMNELSQLQQILISGLDHAETMMQIAEVKRLSAMLYLHDRVMVQCSVTSPVLSCNLRDEIIKAIQQLPVSSGASLWPLFVLGKSNLESPSQAQFVLGRLHKLEQSRYLGSFYHARRRVERNILKRLTEHGDILGQSWEDDSAMNENERWVSLA